VSITAYQPSATLGSEVIAVKCPHGRAEEGSQVVWLTSWWGFCASPAPDVQLQCFDSCKKSALVSG